MTANPYGREMFELERRLKKSQELERHWRHQLEWYAGFDSVAAHNEFLAFEREIASDRALFEKSSKDLSELREKLKQANERASFGLNPWYWFSSERAVARRQAEALTVEIRRLRASVGGMEPRIAESVSKRDVLRKDLGRHRSFDILLAQATLSASAEEAKMLPPRLDGLRAKRDELNERLGPVETHLNEILQERSMLERRISQAEGFEDALNKAATGRDKAMIHEDCNRALGDARPGALMRQMGGKLRALNRDIEKSEKRVKEIVDSQRLRVDKLIIDGSNFCYLNDRDRTPIKFAALEPLIAELGRKYEVTLVFDPQIGRVVGLSNAEVKARFPTAREVHIMRAKKAADELILDAAALSENAYVLSNDRYAEFPDKKVVQQGRVLPYELLDGSVHISALNIGVAFSRTTKPVPRGDAKRTSSAVSAPDNIED